LWRIPYPHVIREVFDMIFVLSAAIALVLSMVVYGLYCVKNGLVRKHAKRLLGLNTAVFFGLLVITTVILFSVTPAGASGASGAAGMAGDTAGLAGTAGDAAGVSGSATDNARGLAFLGAALSTGLATIGAGIAVASTGSAALGAISEDQGILGKTLIFVGLAEGIAIYGLIISILILGQV
jgi:V/A-type H+-transporting ATPase subunit K